MEENYDEIAALFEEELRELDFNDAGEDEYDESLAQIDALGAQLRDSLQGEEDDDEDAEWQQMMTMRKANARFQILEEAVSGDWSSKEKKDSPSSHSEGKKEKKRKKKVSRSRSPSKSRSPSPARSSPSPSQSTSQEKESSSEGASEIAPISEMKGVDDAAVKEKESEEEKSSSVITMKMPQVESAESDPDKIILDLMDTMLNAVASIAALSVRPTNEESGPLAVDMSHLPKMFTSENEEEHERKQVRFASTFDTAAYEERAAILDEAANESEKAKVQAAIDLLRMAEEKLEEEAEEERRLLDRDRQQRLRRKQRMAEELLRAKLDKAAISIQALGRRVLAKARCVAVRVERAEEARVRALAEEEEQERLRAEAAAEAQRVAAEKQAEDDRKFTIAENRRARQEGGLMLDADLEMMSFVNEERFLMERERDHMAAEEESGLFVRMDPGGALESRQQAIQEDWAVRNVEEDPAHWAVFEDGGDIDHAEAQEQEQEEQEQFHFEAASDDETKEGGEGKEGAASSGAPVPMPVPVPVAPLPPPSALSARRALRKAYAERNGTASGSTAAAAGAADRFRVSLVSACLAQAAKPASFLQEGAAAARATLVSHATASPLLRSSPPPPSDGHGHGHGQSGAPVAPSPRAKMGMRLASVRSSPPSSGSQGGAAAASEGLLAAAPQFRCVFSQRLPRTPTVAGAEAVGLLEEGEESGGPRCPLSWALFDWRVHYAHAEALTTEARTRYEADAAMEGKYSHSTTIMSHGPAGAGAGEAPELDQGEQQALDGLEVRRDPGKVTQLELKVEGLSSVSFLRVYPRITSLSLNVNRLRSLDGLQYLPSLSHLEAKDNALADISALAGSSCLCSLSLDDNKVADLSALSAHRGMRRLTVNNNALQTLHSLVGCNFPHLQRLEAYQNSLVNVPEGALRGLSSLSYLDLGRNKLEWISGDALSQCVHLQTLVLSQNRLSELPAPLRLPHLQTLWLSNNRLRSLDAWAPSRNALVNQAGAGAGAGAGAATDVDGSAGAGGSASPPASARFPLFCPLLETLHLQDNQLSAVHEASLLLCPALCEVDLSFNNIASPQALVGLAMCPELRSLQLQENPVTTSPAIGTKDGLLKWVATNLRALGPFGDVDLSNGEVRAHFAGAVTESRIDRLTNGNGHSGCSKEGGTSAPEGMPVQERVRHYFNLPASAASASTSTFDPSLLQLLAAMKLGLSSVRNREKLRKRQVEVAVRGGAAREEAEKDIGAGEEEHAEGLPQAYTQSLLKWPGLVGGWLPLVPLAARVFRASQKNEIAPLAAWQGSLSERCSGKNAFQTRHLCAMTLQALARGFISRRRLAKALQVSEYKDEELDFLVSGGRPPADSVGARAAAAGARARGRFEAHDDDLEQSFDLDEFLSEGIHAPELAQDFFVHDRHRPKPSSEPEPEPEPGTEPEQSARKAPPMVYGDHRSHKKAQRLLQESQKRRGEKGAVPAAAGGDEDKPASAGSADSLIESRKREAKEAGEGGGRDRDRDGLPRPRPMFAPGTASSSLQPASWADDGAHLRPVDKDQASLAEGLEGASPDGHLRRSLDSAQTSSSFNTAQEQDLDRPMSAMTDSSEVHGHGGGEAPRSRQGGLEGMGMGMGLSFADMAVNASPGGGGSVSMSLAQSGRRQQAAQQQQQAEQLAQDWGIKDPKVLALMVKRSRKMQSSQGDASAAGAGASVRGGVKGAASGMSAKVKTGGSGSFGGKPKTQRGNNRTTGRRGVPPAWAKPD